MTTPHVLFNLTLHGHQPVGNLPWVMEECYERCYGPFLELAARYPAIRFSYHLSGCLLEWLLEHRPEHIDLLAGMVARGQVEIIGGAFYEPILASIPRRDALAHIALQRKFTREHFGVDPRGVWLAERVWEPSLPSLLARAGARYTLLDDTHFLAAGLKREDLHGYFLTEDQGELIALFPILKSLRYTIPFGEVEDSLAILRETAEHAPGTMLAYGDDVEKFGVWPETFAHCYEQKWLARFFSALQDNLPWITLVTLDETVRSLPPRGLIYPPETSYVEMNEWALPADVGPVCARVRAVVANDPALAPALPFVRGSSWRNFKVKYPEIRRMYGRSLHISRQMAALPDSPRADEARRELLRGQCNCPYWHGIFGGHYLPHLREGVWRHLLRAEKFAEDASPLGTGTLCDRVDIDLDGRDEVFLRNEHLAAVIAPAGGRVLELDLRPWDLNLFSVLARRKEAYHEDLLRATADEPADATRSIHDIKRLKDPDLARALAYDQYEHLGFTDLILAHAPEPADFLAGRVRDEYGLHSRQWACAARLDGATARVELRLEDPAVPLAIAKTFTLDGRTLRAAYAVTNPAREPWRGCVAVEVPFALQTGTSPRRVWRGPGGEILGQLGAALGGIAGGIGVADWDHDLEIRITAGEAAIASYAIRTVSQSEAGFEGIFQNAVAVFLYDLALAAGETRRWELALTATRAPVTADAAIAVGM
ncbi:MAG TPA: alpha-amylase [Planctomycetes bacterium]|nr:alpha-amylase [Planctomycetota bacterium]